MNRLRWLVHDLAPELAPPPRSLGSGRTRAKLEAGLRALPAGAGRAVALSQLARVTALSAEITGLEKDLAGLVTALVPELLAIPGVAVITAAKIIGETGDIRRFRSPAAFARHNGTAPVPASSGTGTGGPSALTGAAPGSSTPPSTASPWSRPAAIPAPPPCWSAAARTSTRPAKPASASSNATYPTSSTAP